MIFYVKKGRRFGTDKQKIHYGEHLAHGVQMPA